MNFVFRSANIIALFAIAACSSTPAGTGTTTGAATSTGSAAGGAGMTGGGAGTAAMMCHPETDITPASTSATAACKAFCLEEDACSATTTPTDCEAYRRCDMEDTGSAGCVAAAAKYWDCLRAQDDICSPEVCCDTQAAAVGTACAGG